MLRFLDCVSLLAPEGRQVCRNVNIPNSKAPEGRQVDNCVKDLPREKRVNCPETLNLIPMGWALPTILIRLGKMVSSPGAQRDRVNGGQCPPYNLHQWTSGARSPAYDSSAR